MTMRFFGRMRLRALIGNARAKFAAMPLPVMATVEQPGSSSSRRLDEIDRRAAEIFAEYKSKLDELSEVERQSKTDWQEAMTRAEELIFVDFPALTDELGRLEAEQRKLLGDG